MLESVKNHTKEASEFTRSLVSAFDTKLTRQTKAFQDVKTAYHKAVAVVTDIVQSAEMLQLSDTIDFACASKNISDDHMKPENISFEDDFAIANDILSVYASALKNRFENLNKGPLFQRPIVEKYETFGQFEHLDNLVDKSTINDIAFNLEQWVTKAGYS